MSPTRYPFGHRGPEFLLNLFACDAKLCSNLLRNFPSLHCFVIDRWQPFCFLISLRIFYQCQSMSKNDRNNFRVIQKIKYQCNKFKLRRFMHECHSYLFIAKWFEQRCTASKHVVYRKIGLRSTACQFTVKTGWKDAPEDRTHIQFKKKIKGKSWKRTQRKIGLTSADRIHKLTKSVPSQQHTERHQVPCLSTLGS